MASRRSRSPSSPSEGEIIESGSETKATTSQFPLNGSSVDRPTRASITSPAPRSRSPASVSRSPRRRRSRTRSRSRSRSPYRDYRGYKRRRDDDYDDRRPPRRAGGRHDDHRFYDRGHSRRQPPRSYYDYDREEDHVGGLRYSDDYDRRREKRARTGSRSPYREVRKPKQYSGDEWDSHRGETVASRDTRRASTEQLVSERGSTPVVARESKRVTETKNNQVQHVSETSRVDSRWVLLILARLQYDVVVVNILQVKMEYRAIRRKSSSRSQSTKRTS